MLAQASCSSYHRNLNCGICSARRAPAAFCAPLKGANTLTRCPLGRPRPAPLQIPGCDTAYCKYEVVAGEDWQLLDGLESGITQVARQSPGVRLAHVGSVHSQSARGACRQPAGGGGAGLFLALLPQH